MPPPNPPPPPPKPPRGNPLPTALQPQNVALAEIANRLADLGKKAKDANEPLKQTVSLLDQFKKGLVDGAVQLRQLGQLARAPFEGLDTLVNAVNSTITRYVAAISPAAVRLWEISVANLNATIGDVLLPVLENFRAIVKSVSQGIASLNGPGRTLLAVLAGAAVGFAVTAVAVAAVSAALNTLTAGIPAVLGAVAGALAGAFVALKDAKGVKDTFDRVVSSLVAVGNVVARAVLPLVKAILPPLDGLLVQVAKDTAVWADALRDLLPILKAVGEVTGALNPQFLAGLLRNFTGADVLRAFGFGGKGTPLRPEATAVQRVSTSSIDDYLRRLREAGLSSGTAAKKDPGEQLESTNDYLMKIEQRLSKWESYFDDFRKNTLGERAGLAGRTADRVAEGIAPAAIYRGFVRGIIGSPRD